MMERPSIPAAKYDPLRAFENEGRPAGPTVTRFGLFILPLLA
jgi:hypothetical protein